MRRKSRARRSAPPRKAARRSSAVPADRQIRYGRLLGLLFCAGGFTAIGFGWAGAARLDCVDCQLPFLLSGGATGLGLIGFGGILLIMAQLRSDSRRVGARLEEVAAALIRFGGQGAGGRAGDGEVVAGTSTYHRPDCRLVAGKDGLDSLTVARAVEIGLLPCRVCEPPSTSGDGSAGTAAETAETEAVSTVEVAAEGPTERLETVETASDAGGEPPGDQEPAEARQAGA